MSTKGDAFIENLFLEQKSGLHRFVAGRLSDATEAEDITQDAFHNMLQLPHPEQLENPKAYLFQTAANLALNRIRKQRRQQRCEQVIKVDVEIAEGQAIGAMDQQLANREQLDTLMQAVQNLPEKVKTAFMLSRAEDKNYREISEAMGVSVSSVEKYLMTALNHLRAL
jgi:RNA polymerase sigma-70 factor (ECF subfamily)